MNALLDFTVAVLYARRDSIYKTLPGCDVWDEDRDARRWPGGAPVVAHPPCRAWGRLRHMARPRAGERGLALHAVQMVRRYGGVLEHPKASTLWPTAGLPKPGQKDEHGGWTLPVNQHSFGHRAEKATLLYVCGCAPADVPPLPLRLDKPTHVCGSSGRRRDGTRKPHLEITKPEREHTPRDFAVWLCELARRCVKSNARLDGACKD